MRAGGVAADQGDQPPESGGEPSPQLIVAVKSLTVPPGLVSVNCATGTFTQRHTLGEAHRVPTPFVDGASVTVTSVGIALVSAVCHPCR